MKFKFLLPIFAMAALVGCSGNKADKVAETENVETPAEETVLPLAGSWRLLDIVGENEILTTDGEEYTLVLNADPTTFTINTDCNIISGDYTVAGDSLTFAMGPMTLKECPEQNVQAAVLSVFPRVDGYSITDSILRLRIDGRIYATLKAE